jgi:hypothetical protein
MFKYLPDAEIAWRDVIAGAIATAVLFVIGKTLIGLYLGNASVTSTYGAAGSLVVLLLWMYYSAQIFLFGAELTQVYANRYGTRVRPAEGAESVTEAERANQGMPHTDRSGATAGQAATTGAAMGTAAATAPALAAAHDGQALAIVGPYEALPGQEDVIVMGEPLHPMLDQHDYTVALLTFAAGLGVGALVALGSARNGDSPHRSSRRRR